MNGVRTICLALSSAIVLSCAPAPVKLTGSDYCYRCRRYISNTRVAAETISGKPRFVAKFRGPGCMAKYLVDHPDEQTTVYVTDYASARMIPPAGAFYVAEIVDQNTRESDYRAYASEDDARTAAAELNTTTVSWEKVLDEAR